jgi:hypothetical protein
VEREAAALEQRMMPAAARLLRALGQAAQGRRAEPEVLAAAWTASAAYATAVTTTLRRRSWSPPD